jgi:hypothetical protein
MMTSSIARLSVFSAILASMVMGQAAFAEVTVEQSKGGAVVKIDGEVFAEYLTQPGQQPAIWPVIGPTGKPMTRSYPLGPLLKGEMDDHPHHHSIWFNHGDTNKRDFWRSNEESRQDNQIVHREFREIEGDGKTATVVTVNDWMADGKKLCEDERTVVFGGDEDARWIDFTVKMKATEGDVEFGETKEGSFGVRVNGPLTVDSKMGAHITNSRGQMDGDAWGQFADWIDDYGPVDGEVVGIAMFSHPDNFRHPTRWHARTYGLLSANPWGEGEFSPDTTQPKQGATTLKKGEELVLRYRVYLHKGDSKEGGVAEAFEEFASAAE